MLQGVIDSEDGTLFPVTTELMPQNWLGLYCTLEELFQMECNAVALDCGFLGFCWGGFWGVGWGKEGIYLYLLVCVLIAVTGHQVALCKRKDLKHWYPGHIVKK